MSKADELAALASLPNNDLIARVCELRDLGASQAELDSLLMSAAGLVEGPPADRLMDQGKYTGALERSA